MRHRVAGKQLNANSNHRRAMLRNLAAGLFEHGRIETTMAKAKAVQPFVERLITLARRGGLATRRRIESRLTDRRVFAWIADPNVPEERKSSPYFELPAASEVEFNRYGEVRKAPRLVQHLMTRVAPIYRDRPGGYTRIVKLGKHRLGDGTDLVMLELVGFEQGSQVGGRISRRREAADRRTAFAAKLRKGAASSSVAAAAPAAAPAAEGEPSAEA